MSEISNDAEILNLLKNLEQRISQIESRFDLLAPGTIKGSSEEQPTIFQLSSSGDEDEEKLEIQIGQFWLAKIGIIAFTIGITFLLVMPLEGFNGFFPLVIGLLVAAALAGLSWYWRQSESYISEYLLTAGIVTSFISVLRLHFFSNSAALGSHFIEVLLLLIITAITFVLTARKKSFSLAILGLILGSAAAMVSDSELFIFPLLILLSAVVAFLKIKYNWQGLLIAGMAVIYLTHLLWYLNNPLAGKQLLISEGNEYSLLFILIYLFIFSQGDLIRPKEIRENFSVSFISLLNCLFFSGLYCFIMITSKNNALYYLPASILLLSISVIYWIKEQSKFSAFFYSMFGFMLLSAAVLAAIPSPDFYIWLGWQSLIVISTAVWFRSKIIVVANFVIFISILIAYLLAQGNFGLTSISFGVIALSSARILNWQKLRLELTTEQMRNAYLLVALLIVPYSLFKAIPTVYVTFAWIGVAFIYYLLGNVLKNRKYRWMALLTLLLTVGYIFILGFTSGNTTYKILSFLSVGIILIITSVIYSRKKQKINS